MNRISVMLASVACGAMIATAAGAQVAWRNVWTMASGTDSLSVLASTAGEVAVEGEQAPVSDGIRVAFATSGQVRRWARTVDSMAHVSMSLGSPPLRAHWPTVPSRAAGAVVYSHTRNLVDVHELLILDARGVYGMHLALTAEDLERFLHAVDRAAAVTDSLSQRAGVSLRGAPGRAWPDTQVYFVNQVERQVQPVPTNRPPAYPDTLRQTRVTGEVLAQFVVDTNGRADMSTFRVMKSTHDLFTSAVKTALPQMRFFPALIGGEKVKQLVEMPFSFTPH